MLPCVSTIDLTSLRERQSQYLCRLLNSVSSPLSICTSYLFALSWLENSRLSNSVAALGLCLFIWLISYSQLTYTSIGQNHHPPPVDASVSEELWYPRSTCVPSTRNLREIANKLQHLNDDKIEHRSINNEKSF